MALAYATSRPGILKIVAEICNLIAFCCVLSLKVYQRTSRVEAFLAASIGAFVITAILFIVRLADIDNKVNLPWAKIEFIFDVLWSIFYLVVSALLIDGSYANTIFGSLTIDEYIAAGVFGLIAVIVYIVDAVDKYKTGL